ncbi:potassium channel family protein [Geodermatophilus sp. URMC 64]
MHPLAGWLVTAAGAAVVLLALRDIFHTLWHPSGRSGFSRRVMAAVWRAGRPRRGRHRVSVLAGPLSMGLVVIGWVALVALGWTLVYWPHLAGGFVLGSDLVTSGRGGLLDALYLSMVTVATLGFGDIVPTEEWLRIAVPVEALLGFALITAAVTWVLQVYPALTRRRSLAVRLSLLERADAVRVLAEEDIAMTAPLLESLTGELVQARVDLKQYAETYYFRDGEDAESLAANIGTAARLARAAAASPRADVRFAGRLLATALDDLARLLDQQFLRVGGSVDDVLAGYATDHGHRPFRSV